MCLLGYDNITGQLGFKENKGSRKVVKGSKKKDKAFHAT